MKGPAEYIHNFFSEVQNQVKEDFDKWGENYSKLEFKTYADIQSYYSKRIEDKITKYQWEQNPKYIIQIAGYALLWWYQTKLKGEKNGGKD